MGEQRSCGTDCVAKQSLVTRETHAEVAGKSQLRVTFAPHLLRFGVALPQQRVEKLPAIAHDEPEPLPFLMT